MVKKKSKINIEKKVVKTYQFRTLEENEAVKVQYNLLLSAINESVNSLKDAVDGTKAASLEKDIQDEWNSFLNCDSLPKSHAPPEIRDYFYKKLYGNEVNRRDSFLWILDIDERSVLTQDMDIVDMTRKRLELTKINFGIQYDEVVNEGLQVLSRIEESLFNRKHITSQQVYDDIHALKVIGEKCIKSFIDELTYRILSCENAYMNPLNHVSEDYQYEAKDFQCHIWAIQSVPVRFDYDFYPFIKISYEATNSNAVLPQESLHQSMVVRSLHLNYDHYSEYSKSFTIAENMDYLGGLKLALKNEWSKRRSIQTEVRNNMIAERAAYEEYLIQKEIDEAQRIKAAKSQKDDTKKKKPKKDKGIRWFYIPPKITSDTWPIIDKDFIQMDDLEFQYLLEKVNPTVMELDSNEINLRNYRILGGVYEFDFIIKPKNTILPKRIITWHERERLLQYSDIRCHNFNRKSVIDPKSENTKLFMVSIILPENICHFAKPIPCQWIGTIVLETYKSGLSNDPDWENTVCYIEDINLKDILSKDEVYNIVRHTIPKSISSYNFPQETQVVEQTEDKMKGLKKLMPKVSELSLGLEVLTHMKDTTIVKKGAENLGDENKNPERLFPIFEKYQPVVFESSKYYSENTPIYFLSDFVQELDDYKDSIIPYFAEKKKKKLPTHSLIQTSLMGKDLIPDKIKKQQKQLIKRRKTRTLLGDEITAPLIDDVIDNVSPRWSTAHIILHTYDPEKREVNIWTDRLGTFGFAFDLYEHFPYTNWKLKVDPENPEKINFFLETKHAKFEFGVTSNGYTALICDFAKLIKTRKVYLEVTKPIYQLRELIKLCRANNLNVFPERDASWYVNGRYVEKHYEAEIHTYFCMTRYARMMQFERSEWNRLSHRRIIILKCGETNDKPEDMSVIKIIPEEAQFVEVKELCTELTVIQLEYNPTWRNIEFTPDLLTLITSSFPGSKQKQIRESTIVTNLMNLLAAIRPLSFS